MKASNFNLSDYFHRIGYQPQKKDHKVSVTGLSAIMRRQLFSIPFENTEVQAGFVPSLTPEDIVEKIITRNRGGYCYELNALFAMALEAMQVPYFFVCARPLFYSTERPKTHSIVVAVINGEHFLCDLGFGNYGLRAPLRISQLDTEIKQDYDTFKLSKTGKMSATGEREYCLEAKINGKWAKQFSFDLHPQAWIDFTPVNYLIATHPESLFVQRLLIVLFNEQGRTILFGSKLKKIIGNKSHSQIVPKTELAALVLKEFNLTLPYTRSH